MKIAILTLEIIGILSISLLSVCAITALLCMICEVPFTFSKALVIWLVWFGINTIRSKLDERND